LAHGRAMLSQTHGSTQLPEVILCWKSDYFQICELQLVWP
jgi:hypothetical protein